MFRRLPDPLRAGLAIGLMFTLTCCLFVGLCFVCLPAWLIPHRASQQYFKGIANRFPSYWTDMNDFVLNLFMELEVQVNAEVLEQLSADKWYLLIANHQSWTDILILYSVFNRRIPVLKFFIKREIKWVPVIGWGCSMLNYPFVYRYTKRFLKKHPEKAGSDLEATRRACEHFKHHPTAIVNFVEGTRFTQEKHARQNTPHQHLLNPRAGGIAYVLSVLGESIEQLIDVTLVYQRPELSFWQFMCAKKNKVRVHITLQALDASWLGNYQQDVDYRKALQARVREYWQAKDQCIQATYREFESEA